MSIKDIRVLVPITICLAVGGLGSFFTYPSIQNWYQTLNKPSFSPPNIVFGPVWTTLYILMGISVYLIWKKGFKKKKVKTAITFFGIQLFLNFMWSILFFGFHSPLLAFIEIVLLWIMIAISIRKFLPLSQPAAILLIPYISWVSFAAILNLSIVILN